MFSKKNKPTPCEKCSINKVELLSENEDAFLIYNIVQNQAIFIGMNAVAIDLDYNAVKIVMNLYGIEDQLDCFQRVVKVWHTMAAADRMKQKAKESGKDL